MGLFSRKKKDDMNVETLLDQANAASPTGSAPTGSFRLAVDDVFFIHGRGTVVTGRVESGPGRVGQKVTVVRGGAVVATTKISGIEMFRKVMDTAVAGDNVGLLLDGMSKEQLASGDVIQG